MLGDKLSGTGSRAREETGAAAMDHNQFVVQLSSIIGSHHSFN